MRDPESLLVDRVKIVILSDGAGAFQLGSPVRGYRGLDALRDGETYSYAVENGSEFEVGRGVYEQSLGVLTRSPIYSSNGGAVVSFPTNTEVAFTALASDLSVVSAWKDAILVTGFASWAELVAFAPNMERGDRTFVSTQDTGTHADPATGVDVTNSGVYEKDDGFAEPLWLYPVQSVQSAELAKAWAQSDTPPDPADPTSKSAKTWAVGVANSSDVNQWDDAYFEALRQPPAAASFSSLSLDGRVKASAASTIMSWDDAASPLLNPAISVGSNGGVDLWNYIDEGVALLPGQALTACVGLLVPTGTTLSVQAFIRDAFGGTALVTSPSVPVTGDGVFRIVNLAPMLNVAGGTVVDIRVTRSVGSSPHKICAAGVFLGSALRPLTEDMASRFEAREAQSSASEALEKLDTILVPSINLFDVSRPWGTLPADNREGYYVVATSGAITANPLYNASHVIELDAGATYARNFAHQAAFYSTSEATTAQYISGIGIADGEVFTAPSNGANPKVYARFSVVSAAWAQFQVELGSVVTPWVRFGDGINPELLPAQDTEVVPPTKLNAFSLRFYHYLRQKRVRPVPEVAQNIVAQIGDSWSHRPERFTRGWLESETAEQGDGGVGWVGFGFATAGTVPYAAGGSQPALKNANTRSEVTVTFVGNWVSQYGTVKSPDICSATSSTVGDRILVGIPAVSAGKFPALSGFDFFWVGTADGVIRYSWNGGTSWTTLSVQGTVGDSFFAALTGFPTSGASVTLILEVVSGSCRLAGAHPISAASGFVLHKLAASGRTALEFSTQYANASLRASLTRLGFTSLDIFFGTNDQGAARAPVLYKGDVQAIGESALVAKPGIDISVTVPCENQRVNGVKMASYATVAEDLAKEKGWAYYNTQWDFGNPDNPAEYGSAGSRPLFSPDLIHPADATGGRVLESARIRFWHGP